MNLDHIIRVTVDDNTTGEHHWDLLHAPRCVNGIHVCEGEVAIQYSCAIGNEVENNGINAFGLNMERPGIYLVGLETIHITTMHSAWAEVDIRVGVVELVEAPNIVTNIATAGPR